MKLLKESALSDRVEWLRKKIYILQMKLDASNYNKEIKDRGIKDTLENQLKRYSEELAEIYDSEEFRVDENLRESTTIEGKKYDFNIPEGATLLDLYEVPHSYIANYDDPSLYKKGKEILSDIDYLVIYQHGRAFGYATEDFGYERNLESKEDALDEFEHMMENNFLADWGTEYSINHIKHFADSKLISDSKDGFYLRIGDAEIGPYTELEIEDELKKMIDLGTSEDSNIKITDEDGNPTYIGKIKEYIVESKNQLKDMACYNKKRQKGKGWFVNPNAGNVEANIAFMNRALGSSNGEGMGESLNEELIVYNTSSDALDNIDMNNSKEIGIHAGTQQAAKNINKYPNLLKLKISGEKIFDIDEDLSGYWSTPEVIRHLTFLTDDEKQALRDELRKVNEVDSDSKYKKYSTIIRDAILAKGYNMISYKNDSEDKRSTSYIILDPSIITSKELIEESKIEPRQINIKAELGKIDTRDSGTDEYRDLLGMYEMVEFNLSDDKKKRLVGLIMNNDVDLIDNFLQQEIELQDKEGTDLIDLGTFYKRDDLLEDSKEDRQIERLIAKADRLYDKAERLADKDNWEGYDYYKGQADELMREVDMIRVSRGDR